MNDLDRDLSNKKIRLQKKRLSFEKSAIEVEKLCFQITPFSPLVTFGLRARLDPKISCQNPKSEILNFQNNAL